MDKHYVYKITNLKNNKIYIGVRTHPDPANDKYMGSGTCIQKVIEIEGIKYFKKEILDSFSTREEAEEYESSFLTEDFINDPKTYNIYCTNGLNGYKHGFRKDLWYDYYDEIRNRYKNGEPCNQLGLYYKCDKNTIRKIIEDIKRTNSETQNIRFNSCITSGARDLKFDENNLDELLDLYINKKWSVNRIATYFNKSCSFIDRRLKEKNIMKRKRKDNNEKPFKSRKNG